MKTWLAVDIGGTKLAVAIVRGSNILCREQMTTPSSQSPDAMTNALSELISPFLNEVDAVAVASTGIIDHGILTALNPDNLGGLNQYPLQQVLIDMTGLPVTVINDAQAAAWAEYHALSSSSPSLINNMAFITVSTGVGAGLVLDQTLQIGRRGIAGHAGHTLADSSGPRCGCGRIGCVESIASGTAMGVAGRSFLGESSDGHKVYRQHLAGNEQASLIVQRSALTIANLIADLTISLDLDVVVLGGSVGLAQGYCDMVDTALAAMPAIYRPKVMTATAGNDAGLLGVVHWAESNFEKR